MFGLKLGVDQFDASVVVVVVVIVVVVVVVIAVVDVYESFAKL